MPNRLGSLKAGLIGTLASLIAATMFVAAAIGPALPLTIA